MILNISADNQNDDSLGRPPKWFHDAHGHMRPYSRGLAQKSRERMNWDKDIGKPRIGNVGDYPPPPSPSPT